MFTFKIILCVIFPLFTSGSQPSLPSLPDSPRPVKIRIGLLPKFITNYFAVFNCPYEEDFNSPKSDPPYPYYTLNVKVYNSSEEHKIKVSYATETATSSEKVKISFEEVQGYSLDLSFSQFISVFGHKYLDSCLQYNWDALQDLNLAIKANSEFTFSQSTEWIDSTYDATNLPSKLIFEANEFSEKGGTKNLLKTFHIWNINLDNSEEGQGSPINDRYVIGFLDVFYHNLTITQYGEHQELLEKLSKKDFKAKAVGPTKTTSEDGGSEEGTSEESSTGEGSEEEEESIWRKWWFWLIIAICVLIIVGIIVWILWIQGIFGNKLDFEKTGDINQVTEEPINNGV